MVFSQEGPKEADKVVELLPLMNPTSTHMLEPQHLLQNQQWQQQQQQQVLMAGGPPGSSKGMAWMALDPMLAQVAHGPFYYPVPMMWPDPASFQMHLAQYQMTQTVPPQMAMAVQPQLGIAVPVPGQPTPILPTLMPQNAPLASASNPDLSRVFDDVDENRYSVPSPPPLPEDFAFPPPPPPNDAHSTNGGGGGGGMLFNFGQFSHRMSRSQPVLAGTSKLVNELSQEAMDLAEANVVYETHDDGDLMQMLFGVADEMPTMATIHIHKFPSPPLDLGGEAEENGAVAAADSGSASVAGDFCPLSGSSEHGGQEAEGVKRRTSDVEAMHHEQNHDQRSHAGVTVGGMSGTGVCGHRLSSTDQETQQQQQHVAGCSGERGKLGGCLDAAAAAATQGGELWNGLRGVPTANGHEGYDSSFRLVLPTN
ncbi:hypothetical protein CEUSTIGMA_g5295.t1 [Chlamydomonas eustigma]|uniref:Uncharacterized protein n=1 Tax=Chlamydomonas eustigma TaxID=1157962 RepID=A0A250X448_9CHLO|nr:hypothetical protein CEUSTIGMA_g5295.t1 [Chlamydomonas eustigma]|eukprot:GAX77853.1 hypothetical protein CEUSTIGMA_g5295.t1 [Chlamydomonas eustigma]